MKLHVTIFSDRAGAYALRSYISLLCVTLPLISGMTRKDFTHRAPLENTGASATGFSRSRATLFIFWRCALTLPFVYGHKYSFKPPPWYLDEAIRLSSLILDHQSSLDRPGVTGRATRLENAHLV